MYSELIQNLNSATSGKIYLDHASSTTLRSLPTAVLSELAQNRLIADPSRIYMSAIAVRDLIEYSRAVTADYFQASLRQIVFTSSASEAINQAIFDSTQRSLPDGVVLVGKVEHSAVKRAASEYGKIFKHKVVELQVDGYGRIDLDSLESILKKFSSRNIKVALCAVQYANHEIGSKQPITEVSQLCTNYQIPLLVDLANAISNDILKLDDIDYTYLAVSGHKLGGPVGSGALVIKKNHLLKPMIHGANQELKRRGGLENLFAIAGLSAAIEEISNGDELKKELNNKSLHIQKITEALKSLNGIEFYGAEADKLCSLVSFGIEGIQSGALTLQLDQMGVSIHSGSACSNELTEPSYILEAIGKSEVSPIRISVGWDTENQEIDVFLAKLNEAVAILSKYKR